MSSAFRLRSAAEEDVRAAIEWYEEHRRGLGGEFLAELDHVLERIKDAPLRFPEVAAGVRRALLNRFPYAVYFVANPDDVDILAVLHLRREPRGWKGQ